MGDLQQRVGLQVMRLGTSRLGRGVEGEEGAAVHIKGQRQGRTAHKNPAAGVGLRDAIQHLSDSQ
jgi:hypothetical protein